MTKMFPSIISLVVILTVSIIMLTVSTTAYPDSDKKKFRKDRHEDVYRQRQSHNILPFQVVLKKVRPHIQGEIIETEFEIEDGIPIYEFKYIDKNGHVLEMEVDARTGRIIKVERD